MSDQRAESNTACEGCGEPVRVRILEGYRAGQPVIRAWGMTCADRLSPGASDAVARRARERLSVGALLIMAGLGLGFMGVFGRHVGVEYSRQIGTPMLAACFGAFLVLIGALLRVDVIGIIGTMIFGVAVCIELIGLAGTGDAAIVPDLELVLGLGLVAGGMWLRRRMP